MLAYCGLLEVRAHERFDAHPLPAWQRDRIQLVCRDYLDESDGGEPGSDLADPLTILERASDPPERPLPAFFISVGTADPIQDDSVRLGRALDRLGVPNEVGVFPDEIHAFQAIFWRPAARESWRRALGLAALSTIATDRSNGLLAHHVGAAAAATSGFDRAFVVCGFIALAGALLALTLPSRASHVAAVRQSAAEHEQQRAAPATAE